MRQWPLVIALVVAGCGSSPTGGGGPDMQAPSSTCAGWPQWGQGNSHGGQVCVGGQLPARFLATVVVDPFVKSEAAGDGSLRIHYQVPLIIDDDVYVLQKSGTFSAPCPAPDAGAEAGCYSENSQSWNETYFAWRNGQISRRWTFETDWKPVPNEVGNSEQMFQPVISGRFLYLPGLGGTVHKIDRHSGVEAARLSPFPSATPDPDTYVSGPLVADDMGNVYYNVIKLEHYQPLSNDGSGWLVKVAPDGTVTSATYDSLVPSAPHGMSCHGTFYSSFPSPPLPWPPPDVNGQPVMPPMERCGSQRPGVNVAPAISSDGTIFTVSRAHFNSRDSFIVAVNASLTPKWATSLRDLLDDGCGVFIPSNGDPMTNPYACRPGATKGVDPITNQKPAGRVIDDSSGSPVALPDGGVAYGAFTVYNNDRGHLMKFDASGKFTGSYDFGWDYTPAVYQHDGTYSLIVKDNNYNFDNMGTPLGPYYVTQLSKDMAIEWQFQNTNTQSCTTNSAGVVSCVPDHPHGFEWCINAPAVDRTGTVYAGGEDGVIYAIGQNAVLKGQIFVGMAIGASYTPLAIDHAGRIYTQNDGVMQILGQ